MLGRGKKLRPGGAGMPNPGGPGAGVQTKGARRMNRTGKVFRKNAGFPWRRATMLG